jgi:hypothetical protein
MNIQNTFYILGIIYMTLYTLLLIAVVILLFYIKKRINDAVSDIKNKLEIAKDIISHPKEIAAEVGRAVTATALDKASEFLKNRKRKK